MADVKVPRGKMLLKLDQTGASFGSGSVGIVVAVGSKPLSPMGDEIGFGVQVGDRVHFRMFDADDQLGLPADGHNMMPHAVIDHFQVRLIEPT